MITPERKELIFNRLKEDYALLEKRGYEVLGVFLYGSDNYGLSDEQSDIDTKAIIIPKFDDLVFNREYVSDTFIENDNSLMDVKDIRFMFKIYLKQNINFLETLFTPYCELNPEYIGYYSGTIFKNAEKIADQIHFWKDIDDVNKVFKKYKVELNYNSMESFTYPVKDSSWPMAWVFDMSVSSDYNEELKLYRKQPAKLLAGKLKDIFKKKGGK